jgi:hypothetical protein
MVLPLAPSSPPACISSLQLSVEWLQAPPRKQDPFEQAQAMAASAAAASVDTLQRERQPPPRGSAAASNSQPPSPTAERSGRSTPCFHASTPGPSVLRMHAPDLARSSAPASPIDRPPAPAMHESFHRRVGSASCIDRPADILGLAVSAADQGDTAAAAGGGSGGAEEEGDVASASGVSRDERSAWCVPVAAEAVGAAGGIRPGGTTGGGDEGSEDRRPAASAASAAMEPLQQPAAWPETDAGSAGSSVPASPGSGPNSLNILTRVMRLQQELKAQQQAAELAERKLASLRERCVRGRGIGWGLTVGGCCYIG